LVRAVDETIVAANCKVWVVDVVTVPTDPNPLDELYDL
jgi:hypothetical protein